MALSAQARQNVLIRFAYRTGVEVGLLARLEQVALVKLLRV